MFFKHDDERAIVHIRVFTYDLFIKMHTGVF